MTSVAFPLGGGSISAAYFVRHLFLIVLVAMVVRRPLALPGGNSYSNFSFSTKDEQ